MLSKSSLKLLCSVGQKGGRALLMSLPCMESRGCQLIASFYVLSCYFFSFGLLLFLLSTLQSPAYFPENDLNCFFLETGLYVWPLFLVVFLWRLGDDILVGDTRGQNGAHEATKVDIVVVVEEEKKHCTLVHNITITRVTIQLC